jgi:hypothetical protein
LEHPGANAFSSLAGPGFSISEQERVFSFFTVGV